MVLSGGGWQGLALVRAAGELPGVRVAVADSLPHPVTAALADDVVRVPPVAEESAFLAAVEAYFERAGPGLLLPAAEHDLDVLARHRERLERAGARVGASAPRTLERLGDRETLAEELGAVGVPVAPRLAPTDVASAELPLLAKPRRAGWGGRGQLRLSDEAARAAFLRRADRDRFVVEPLRASFRELSVDFAVGFAGEVSELVVRERLRTTGGFCVVASSIDDEAPRRLAGRVARRIAELDGRGLFNLQLFDASSGSYVSDLNLRVGTSSVFALERGVNLVEFLVRSARGESPAHRPPAAGRRQWRLLVERSRPAALPPVEGLLFDLDDTLLDHKAWVGAKLDAVAERFADELGDPGRFLLEAWTAFEEGERARTLDVALARAGLDPALGPALVAAYREADVAAPIYADVRGSLAALREAGLRAALVTDNPPESQRRKLAASGLAPFFDAVVFTREVGAEKPSPAGFAAAARGLGLDPARLAAVGDHPLRDGRAALAVDAAHFFWIQRAGGVMSVHPATFARRLPELARRTSRVETLREVVDALLRP